MIEPLRLVEDKKCEYSHAIYQGDRIVAYIVKHDGAEATGKRLVACYNALAGVSDERLGRIAGVVEWAVNLDKWVDGLRAGQSVTLEWRVKEAEGEDE